MLPNVSPSPGGIMELSLLEQGAVRAQCACFPHSAWLSFPNVKCNFEVISNEQKVGGMECGSERGGLLVEWWGLCAAQTQHMGQLWLQTHETNVHWPN